MPAPVPFLFLPLHFPSFLLLPNISFLLSSYPQFWPPKKLLWKACQHVCQQNESKNWKCWPWILSHEQYIKGRLLCEIYGKGKFEVEGRQSRRTPPPPLTARPSCCPQLQLWGRGKKQDGYLYAICPCRGSGPMKEYCQTKSQSTGFPFKNGPKLKCRVQRKKEMGCQKETKGVGACACWGPWIFSYRGWGGIEEFKQ